MRVRCGVGLDLGLVRRHIVRSHGFKKIMVMRVKKGIRAA